MRRFADLYQALDASTATGDKLAALDAWLAQVDDADAAWGVWFLSGGKPRQVVPMRVLREVAIERAGIADWLFEASYQAVGDLAETIALVVPDAAPHAGLAPEIGLAAWVEQRLLPLRGMPPDAQRLALRDLLQSTDTAGRYLAIKLMGGGFRVGVSRLLVQRALARRAGVDAKLIAQRMMGWADARQPPTAAAFARLLRPATEGAPGDEADDPAQPYPFFLAHPLDRPPEQLGSVAHWQAEWKYDGVRAQLVRRAGRSWLWTRGEELVSERFPEVIDASRALTADAVLDGELLVWPPGAATPAPFAQLQRRLNRKTVGRTLLAEAPVRFVAYDLLEQAGQDLRGEPLETRREHLAALLAQAPGIALSPRLDAPDWATLAAIRGQARAQGTEGLMLKALGSGYGVGRTRRDGLWWKWKLDPMTVDAVLLYAQAGHGRRAGLYSDYTFAIWNRPPRDAAEASAVVEAITQRRPPQPDGLQLVSLAKAYSGLDDAEMATVDRVIRQTTLERFGPVRSVRPTLIFELGFEGIAVSPRHKSGYALRFPRMLRLRPDKPLHEADSIDSLQRWLPANPSKRA